MNLPLPPTLFSSATNTIWSHLQQRPLFPIHMVNDCHSLQLPQTLKNKVLCMTPMCKCLDLVCTYSAQIPISTETIYPSYTDFESTLFYNMRRIKTSIPDQYGGCFLEVHDCQSKLSFLLPTDDEIADNIIHISTQNFIPDKDTVVGVLQAFDFAIDLCSDLTAERVNAECDINVQSSDITISHSYYRLLFSIHTHLDTLAANNFSTLAENIANIPISKFDMFLLNPNDVYFYC